MADHGDVPPTLAYAVEPVAPSIIVIDASPAAPASTTARGSDAARNSETSRPPPLGPGIGPGSVNQEDRAWASDVASEPKWDNFCTRYNDGPQRPKKARRNTEVIQDFRSAPSSATHGDRARLTESEQQHAEQMVIEGEQRDEEARAQYFPPAKNYQCSSCLDMYQRSSLLPIHPNLLSWQGSFCQVCYDCLQCRKFPPARDGPQGRTFHRPAIDDDDTFDMNSWEFAQYIHEKNYEMVVLATDHWLCEHCAPNDPHGQLIANYEWRTYCYHCGAARPNSTELWISVMNQHTRKAPVSGPRPAYNSRHPGWFSHQWFYEKNEYYNQQRFQNAQRTAWIQVIANRKGTFQCRVRAMTYQKVLEDLLAEYPGTSKAKRRAILAERAQLFVDAYRAARESMTAEQNARTEAALDRFHDEYERAADDIDFQAKLAETMFPQDHYAQFMDDINKFMSMNFSCRRKICRHFGRATEWIQSVLWPPDLEYDNNGELIDPQPKPKMDMDEALAYGGQYMCPKCGCIYQPWVVDLTNLVPAQKVFAVRVNSTQWNVWLCEWPDTTTQNLINELKGIYAEVKSDCANLDILSLQSKLTNMVAHPDKPFYKTIAIDDYVLASVENANSTRKKLPWRLKHLRQLAGKYYFDHATYEWKDDTVILTQSDLIRIFAYMRFIDTYKRSKQRIAESRGSRDLTSMD